MAGKSGNSEKILRRPGAGRERLIRWGEQMTNKIDASKETFLGGFKIFCQKKRKANLKANGLI